MGLTLLELVLGRYPFHPDSTDTPPLSEFELLQVIINDPIPTVPRPGELGGGAYSNEFCDFIAETLHRDAQARPTPMILLRSNKWVLSTDQVRVDMVAWARTFLTPNLNDQQKQRWSMSQKEKRISMAERRRTRMGVGGLDALGAELENMGVSSGSRPSRRG